MSLARCSHPVPCAPGQVAVASQPTSSSDMVKTNLSRDAAPSRRSAQRILADTAHAVRVMKASWLAVALNLKKIREHELWRFHEPPCESYEEYAFGVLKLNKHVAQRMMQAMGYTAERRPDLLERFATREEDVDVPSYDVLNQLRRAEPAFEGHEEAFRDLESRVFDEGVGRVVLKREIDERLAEIQADDEPQEEDGEDGPADSVGDVVRDLMEIESRLLALDVPKKVRRLAFELIEALERIGAKRQESGD